MAVTDLPKGPKKIYLLIRTIRETIYQNRNVRNKREILRNKRPLVLSYRYQNADTLAFWPKSFAMIKVISISSATLT